MEQLREKNCDYPCIVCRQPVKKRQEAVACEGCDRWQHRTCNTGIGRQTYRDAVRFFFKNLEWECEECKVSYHSLDVCNLKLVFPCSCFFFFFISMCNIL